MVSSEKPRVLVDPFPRRMEEIFSPEDMSRLHDTVEVLWGHDPKMADIDAGEALREVTAVVSAGWTYGDVLDRAQRLQAIIDVSGGFPALLNYQQCFARQIRVLTCAPAFAPQVAEMALGLALAATREIVGGDRAMRAGTEGWGHAGNVGTFTLYGRRVGFIGFGSLAQSLRVLLAPFGCSLAVYDPWLSTGYLRSSGVTPATLESLLETSQVIFVLASPTSENSAMLSRRLLERIQPRAVLVLISRAHVVDFDALTELVLAGRFTAAIDVFPVEPLAPDHPIRTAPGAILSAHRAGSVKEDLWQIGTMVIDDLEAIAQGLPPRRLQAATPELAPRYARARRR
jgi:phosphoglycerate dehydrogenase-like enzyme